MSIINAVVHGFLPSLWMELRGLRTGQQEVSEVLLYNTLAYNPFIDAEHKNWAYEWNKIY